MLGGHIPFFFAQRRFAQFQCIFLFLILSNQILIICKYLGLVESSPPTVTVSHSFRSTQDVKGEIVLRIDPFALPGDLNSYEIF